MNGAILGAVFGILSTMALTIYILVKEVVVPRRNSKKATQEEKTNPINLDRFFQEFQDFKKTQGLFNKRIEEDIGKLEDKINKPRRR